MADAEFEIDFYGDATNDQQPQPDNVKEEEADFQDNDGDYKINNSGDHSAQAHGAEEATSQQGVKRKSEEADRPVDPNATSAVMISELNWWTTDDDIRGWLRKAECEDEVKELTFSEHKVNGKSKGQAYVEFVSRQAATAAKHYVDQFAGDASQSAQKKMTTSYWNPGMNPFRTLPKDAPARVKEQQPRTAPSGPYNDRGNYGGGFRGRGGFNGGRGNMGQGNFNRNYNNNNMGYNNNMGGGFNGPMGGGGNFGFGGRGNMMGGGMRGGPGGMRGGRGGNMMGMGPMGGMPMGMPGNMGMMGMGGGMPGFQGMNPGFNAGGFGFGQNQGGGGNGDWGNPHGAKRPRPE
ncbi:hypothetical protein HIM_01505 [Hirsutella minnesotensis 3608]|nr:hypothetical protein HIM_01505 [Hirsutella minnesotensis 3608]